MTSRWRMRGLSVGIVGLLACGLATAAWLNGAESEEARAVKDAFRRNVEKIKSLDVSYQLDTTTELTSEQLRSMPEYRNKMFLPKDEWRQAFLGEKRYRRQIQPEEVKLLVELDEYGLFAPPEAGPNDPPAIRENQKKLREGYDRTIAELKANQARGIPVQKRKAKDVLALEKDVTFGFNGKTIWRRKPTDPKRDEYMIWPTKSPADWFQGTGYLAAVGLHVPDPTGRPEVRKAQGMFQLSELINHGDYDLEPKTEVIDGSTCVILAGSLNSLLQPGFIVGKLTDRIWLDRDHGFVLRKREMATDGKVGWRFTTTDLKEVEPGIWLPLATRGEEFPKDAPDLGGKPTMVETLKVKNLSVNHVADSLFDMTPQQGDRIDDLRGQF
ncbi:MAG: hypothetical protein P4L85_10725 [Paludisphaera borealis]|uniref:hypothetical protein n=1 Tax=Paludisphaera borealis TaxID=1387353 RepID=UPI00284671E9|nr:hypothetical protein [Paludisphaera borealis]MDR3619812.1 hypothetical protein [Paludisphaera borealis]